MCGRFTLFATAADLGERFSVEVPAEYTPRYNVAPSQPIPVVANDDPDSLQFRTWGLLPSWADEPDGGQINARAETVEERPSFESAVRSRRCLIPADGFYEWTGERDSRQPYRIASEDDRRFAMAGIWERWEGPKQQTGLGDFAEGGSGTGNSGDSDPPTEVRETVAILTTEAAGAVAEVHDRMPVILPRERERDWLDADEAEARAELLTPFEDPAFRAYRVSPAVNDPSNDAPGLVESIEG